MSASVKHQYAVRYADGFVSHEGSEGEARDQYRYAAGQEDAQFDGAHVVRRTVTVTDWEAAA